MGTVADPWPKATRIRPPTLPPPPGSRRELLAVNAPRVNSPDVFFFLFCCGTTQVKLPLLYPLPLTQQPSCLSEAGRVWSRSWERRPWSRPGRAGKESPSRTKRRERPDSISLSNIKTVNCKFGFDFFYLFFFFWRVTLIAFP